MPRDVDVSVSSDELVVGGTSNRPSAIVLTAPNGDKVKFGYFLSSREREWILDELRSVLGRD